MAKLSATHIREGGFILRAELTAPATAAVRFAVVDAHVAERLLPTASDPRRAMLCAAGICGSLGQDIWPSGSILAHGILHPSEEPGASLATCLCSCNTVAAVGRVTGTKR
jgi:hypothetical protein